MKPIRIAILSALVLLVASSALAAGKGTTLYGLELSNGTADFYSGGGGQYLSAYDHSELGVQGQIWHFLTDDFALTVSGGVGYFSETDKPGSVVNPNIRDNPGDIKYTQNSFNVRVGGDRFAKLGDRAWLFFGPGVEYWSGKAKYDDPNYYISSGNPLHSKSWETQNISRISLSGRVGTIMKISDGVSLSCQLGRKLGLASTTDHGAKVSWWPSSFDAAGGVLFGFGK